MQGLLPDGLRVSGCEQFAVQAVRKLAMKLLVGFSRGFDDAPERGMLLNEASGVSSQLGVRVMDRAIAQEARARGLLQRDSAQGDLGC